MVLDKHDLKKLRENGKNIDELIESFDCKTADDIRNNCESYEPRLYNCCVLC